MFVNTKDVKEKYSNIWMLPMEITYILFYLKRNKIYNNEQTKHDVYGNRSICNNLTKI
jgi:hypothetical protein